MNIDFCMIAVLAGLVLSSVTKVHNTVGQDLVRSITEVEPTQEKKIVPVAEMPTERFFMGNEFWYSNRFNVTELLGVVSTHDRNGELRASQAEIEEAVTWLQIVKANADWTSKTEIQRVITDLEQVASQLDVERSISAKKLNRAFANAKFALARQHFSKANKLAEQTDLMNASRRLVAAADHMQNAAYSADVTTRPIVGTFRAEYSPYGTVNETLERTPEQLRENLDKLALTLKSLRENARQSRRIT